MTFRSPNKIIELEGENYVRGVVQSYNCIFQLIEGKNDQGNDVYIELVVDNNATNFGFFAQIKSGISYKDSSGYKIPTNKDHLNYWNSALYPIIGIVYDPELKSAFWVDIKDYISHNSEALEKNTHSVRVPTSQEFSTCTFLGLRDHFIGRIQEYKSMENFGRSLDLFSRLKYPDVCYEGFKSLYSNHKDKDSTLFYVLSAFSKIKEEGIRRNILGILSNYLDNPNIFWHASNIQYFPSRDKQNKIKDLLTQNFGLVEIRLTIPYLREGILIGSFSYLAYRIINEVENVHLLLKQLAFEPDLDADDRNRTFWLYLHIAKHYSVEETLKIADEYLKMFPYGFQDEALIGTKESIEIGDLTPIGHF